MRKMAQRVLLVATLSALASVIAASSSTYDAANKEEMQHHDHLKQELLKPLTDGSEKDGSLELPNLAVICPLDDPLSCPKTVKLLIMRHAQSQTNVWPCGPPAMTWNGVVDPLITKKDGKAQALSAAEELKVSPDFALASTLIRTQQTALLAFGNKDGEICNGHPVHIAPYIAEKSAWGIDGSCGSRHYKCNKLTHPAQCNTEYPSDQIGNITKGKNNGNCLFPCKEGATLGSQCTERLSWDLVGGESSSYCSHGWPWGEPDWSKFWGWLWSQAYIWQEVVSVAEPTVVIVSHANMMEKLLGTHPHNVGTYVQTVTFGGTPNDGICSGEGCSQWSCLLNCKK